MNARVNIQDATFYTYEMSKSKASLLEINDNDSTLQIIGEEYIGKILGADIVTSENIEIEIKYKEEGNIKILPVAIPNDNSKCTIFLKTTPYDDDNEEEGHMKLIYKHLIEKPSNSPRYDYKFNPREPSSDFCGGDIKATQFACDNNGGGEGSLPELP